jgi:hypothetical protein
MNIRGIVLVAVVLFGALSARAEIFTAYLTPVQEVPPTASSATGYARVVVNEAAGTLTFTVVFNNLTSAQTLSHIHAPAAIGATAAVAINFGTVGGTSGTITGSAAITPAQLAQIRQHLGYVNVHSVNFPNGEIRGQLGVERPNDYDGDGRTDLSILRFPSVSPPATAQVTWWNLNSTGGPQNFNFGDANQDFPAPGDYDGDGITDIALYRAGATVGAQSKFFIFRSVNSTVAVINFGLNGDRPVARDYDGDGLTDPAVFRPGGVPGTQDVWWLKLSTGNGAETAIPFGLAGDNVNNFDTPVPGDYDGDGKADLAVYRIGNPPANTFIVRRSSDGGTVFQTWGNFNSDWIVPGDYDGDGKTDFCAVRTGANATDPMDWWILQSSDGSVRVQRFGISSDLPAQGDYDGDARTDVAVYRPGASAGAQSFYWVLRSFDGTVQTTAWGLGGDFSTNRFDIR